MKLVIICFLLLHFTSSIQLQDLPYLSHFQLAELVSAVENKVKEIHNEQYLGGFHDYTLSEEVLIEKLFELINSEGNAILDFIEAYQLSETKDSEPGLFLKEVKESPLVEYLSHLTKEIILEVAAKVEELTRKRYGEMILGGLHDIIRKEMTVLEIAREIEKYVNEMGLLTFVDVRNIVLSLMNN